MRASTFQQFRQPDLAMFVEVSIEAGLLQKVVPFLA
jgi:hypothetical protein